MGAPARNFKQTDWRARASQRGNDSLRWVAFQGEAQRTKACLTFCAKSAMAGLARDLNVRTLARSQPDRCTSIAGTVAAALAPPRALGYAEGPFSKITVSFKANAGNATRENHSPTVLLPQR